MSDVVVDPPTRVLLFFGMIQRDDFQSLSLLAGKRAYSLHPTHPYTTRKYLLRDLLSYLF